MDLSTPARCRIAPSPTGDPHVGTAYMALFNRALADKTGGQFLFRLDDTDQNRRDETSEAKLFETLAWLGIQIDEGPHIGGPHAPYRQSERLETYRRYAEKLVEVGAAYYCFATADELELMRKIQQREGRAPAYDRRWRDRPRVEVEAKLAEGAPYVIRVAMPLEGEVAFEDLLRGRIAFPAADLDDKVIWKTDGFPTYHLANIVDDHEFGITHIIRGEEWLSSVPLHCVMIDALGMKRPVFIHMPLLRNADRTKVSKRKNPTSLTWFRDAGFIPEGMLNFLGMMGFSLPDDQEIFSYQEFVQHFDPSRIALGGPVFDLKKLEWCNGEHLRKLEVEDLRERLVAHISRLAGKAAEWADPPADDPIHQQGTYADSFRLKANARNRVIGAQGASWLERPDVIAALVPHLRERLHTLSEAADYLPGFFEELPELPVEDIEGIKKFSADDKLETMRLALEVVSGADFAGDPAAVCAGMESELRAGCELRGWKVGPAFMTVRLSALRAKISPPLFESMLVLGKEVTQLRLRDAIEQWQGRAPGELDVH